MRAQRTVVIMAVLAAILFFAVSSSTSSGETVKVVYEENKFINVSFPNGKEIEKGGELIIITSSDTYDMDKSGITFFEIDENGNTIKTSSIIPMHEFDSDGNTMKHIFNNIQTDIEMIFSDLKPLNKTEDDILTTAVLGASVIIAAVMMVFMMVILREIDAHLRMENVK